MKRLLTYCYAYWPWYLGSFFALALSCIFAVLIPAQVEKAIDGLGSNQSLAWCLFLLLVLAFFQAVLRILSRILIYYASREQEHEFRMMVLEKTLSSPCSEIGRFSRGDMVTRMIEDSSQVRSLVGWGFIQLGNITLLYLFALPCMLQISPSMTLAAVAPYPILLFFIWTISSVLYNQNLQTKLTLGEITDFTSLSIQGVQTVQSHRATDSFVSQMGLRVKKHYLQQWKVARLEFLLYPGIVFLAGLGEWAMIRYGIPGIQRGEITLGQFLAFHGYIAYLLQASISVGFGVATLNRGLASFSRLMQLKELEPEDLTPRSPKALQALSFENLSLTYPGSAKSALYPMQAELTFPGRYALVGAVGSGKSTLLHVLAGLQKSQGQILFNQEDWMQKDLLNLRTNLTLLPQESFLIPATIRENITFGLECTDAEIWQILDTVAMSEDVKRFAEGLGTIVGERGVTLSSGQKQRICLARLMLGKSRIFLLDDPFSAMDLTVENQIMQNLKQKNISLILATHRVLSVQDFDRIFVLQEGHLLQSGKHQELMQTCETYRQMLEIQAREY